MERSHLECLQVTTVTQFPHADAKYFTESVHNYFPEEKKRAQFLDKFYQCLLAFRFPHKLRKLVVVGPKDSGKTTWASGFLGICPLRFVASITKEKQFSAAMINDDTQIVLLDEWSENTLQADLAKTVLQGGYMVTAVKHGEARTIINQCPFYITTNQVPKFGADDVNVKRRIVVFETVIAENRHESRGLDSQECYEMYSLDHIRN